MDRKARRLSGVAVVGLVAGLAWWAPGVRTGPLSLGAGAEVSPDGTLTLHGSRSTAWHLRTLSAGRAGASSAPAARSARRGAGGEVVLSAPGLEEVLAAHRGGVEQSWTMATSPPGTGDLVVRVSCDAEVGHPDGHGGVILARGPHRLRAGAGTWRDARGRQVQVPVHWRSGALELRVPAEELERASYPAVLDPLLSPLEDVDSPLAVRALGGGYPSVGASAEAFLVAQPSGGGLAVLRVARDGGVLDPLGIAVGSCGVGCKSAVASDGRDFLVAWQEQGPTGAMVVQAVRVSAGGQVLDSPPLVLGEFFEFQGPGPRVGFDGTQYLVTFPAYHGVTSRVRPDGTILDPGGSPLPFESRELAVAGSPGQFLLVWTSSATQGAWSLEAARLDVDGGLLDPAPIPIGVGSRPSVVWDGRQYLVVASGPDQGARAWRVSAQGELLDPAPLDLQLRGTVRAAFDGQRATVVALEPTGASYAGVQVTPDALVGTPQVIYQLLPYRFALDLAASGGLALLVGDDLVPVSGALEPAVVGTSLVTAPALLVPGSRTPLLRRLSAEWEPTAASTASTTLVAWSDDRRIEGAPTIVGRLRSAGDRRPLGESFLVTGWGDQGSRWRVSAASDGRDFLAAWESGWSSFLPTVKAGRILADGGRPDGDDGVSVGQGSVGTVASGGGTSVVFWLTLGADVAATRFAPDGQRLDATALLAPPTPMVWGSSAVSATFAGGAFVVAWLRGFPPAMEVARFEPGGTWQLLRVAPPPPTPQEDGGLPPPRPAQGAPAVASDGRSSLLVWPEPVDGLPTLLVAFLEADGGFTPADGGLPLLPSDAGQEAPRAVFDGVRYLVAWLEPRDGLTQVRGVHLTRQGALVEPEGLWLSESDGGVGAVAATAVPGGALVAFSDLRPELGVQRVAGRYLDSPCAGDADCASGSTCSIGSCEPVSARCTWSAVPDRTPCEGGACVAGACVATSAGRPDAGEGPADGGPDGGSGGGGAVDGGSSDGGQGSGGDGGTPPDGGPTGAGHPVQGCGCQAATAPLLAGVAALWWAFRRRCKKERWVA